MRIAVFDTHRRDRAALEEANAAFGHELVFLEPRLNAQTASLGAGVPAVCSFVNDRVDRAALAQLRNGGVKLSGPAGSAAPRRGSRPRRSPASRRSSAASR